VKNPFWSLNGDEIALKMIYRKKSLVLLRHGESTWNRENRFTGWTDVDLTEDGIREAHEAAKLLKSGGYDFDVAFTSVLKRAIRTLWIVLDDLDMMWIPVHRSWRLNERYYGGLQGLDKKETAGKYGLEQVFAWRRSYDVQPPPIEENDPRHPKHDRRYAELEREALPRTESLRDTLNRVLPYWHGTIVPFLKQGQRVIVSAHGNSIRALVKYLDGISNEDIPNLNIPTGIPLVYELDDRIKALTRFYLGDEKVVQEAAESVARQLGGDKIIP